jgi:hypothetical protein
MPLWAVNGAKRVARVPIGLAVGTIVFAAGFIRLIRMSTRLTASVMNGTSATAALDRMQRERQRQAEKL